MPRTPTMCLTAKQMQGPGLTPTGGQAGESAIMMHSLNIFRCSTTSLGKLQVQGRVLCTPCQHLCACLAMIPLCRRSAAAPDTNMLQLPAAPGGPERAAEQPGGAAPPPPARRLSKAQQRKARRVAEEKAARAQRAAALADLAQHSLSAAQLAPLRPTAHRGQVRAAGLRGRGQARAAGFAGGACLAAAGAAKQWR